VEKIVACPLEQCRFGGCGAETTVIGYEDSEQLGVDPAKYFVLATKREKRACKRRPRFAAKSGHARARLSNTSRTSNAIPLPNVYQISFCSIGSRGS
jgi:hypothetical protein